MKHIILTLIHGQNSQFVGLEKTEALTQEVTGGVSTRCQVIVSEICTY